MELSLIRHAQSERNVVTKHRKTVVSREEFDRLRNIPDHKVALTDKGHAQAKNSGPGISAEIKKPDIIFTSGWQRTNETLESLKSGMDIDWDAIPVIEEFALRERENGYSWVYTTEEHDEMFPYVQHVWDVVGPALARPFGGESIIDIIEKRLHRFVDVLKREHSGKRVCLVVHGRVITGIRAILQNFSLEDIENVVGIPKNGPRNVGLTMFRYSPWTGKLEPQYYNKVFH